jgi:hypothetical protein
MGLNSLNKDQLMANFQHEIDHRLAGDDLFFSNSRTIRNLRDRPSMPYPDS